MQVSKVKKLFIILAASVTFLAAAWYTLFSLKPYEINAVDINSSYSYKLNQPVTLQLQQANSNGYNFTYTSFDGAQVNGHLRYPKPLSDITSPIPVLIGLHGMGRSQVRWWQDSYKGRPTLEYTDNITALALQKGYAVIAIDARNHGDRKDPLYSLTKIINNLHWWGQRQPYETMLVDTVRDHRVLLDWLVQQPQFDTNNINTIGYSMGAQLSLLLAAVDPRIQRVAAIVPPHMNNNTAIVAPQNMLAGLVDNQVWLLSADDDEYASKTQNAQLFNALPNNNKQHFTFAGGHLLPENYIKTLEAWL